MDIASFVERARRPFCVVVLALLGAFFLLGCSVARGRAGGCTDPWAGGSRGSSTAGPSCGGRSRARAARTGLNSAKVLRDVDGDTIYVRLPDGRERYVRLIGIDTPEDVKPDYPVECGSRPAAASMRQMVAGQMVRLVPDRTQARVDRYGRLLDYVFVGATDVDLEQVRRGWAEVYVFGHPFVKLASFRTAQARASEKSRGVWGRCGGDFHSAA